MLGSRAAASVAFESPQSGTVTPIRCHCSFLHRLEAPSFCRPTPSAPPSLAALRLSSFPPSPPRCSSQPDSVNLLNLLNLLSYVRDIPNLVNLLNLLNLLICNRARLSSARLQMSLHTGQVGRCGGSTPVLATTQPGRVILRIYPSWLLHSQDGYFPPVLAITQPGREDSA